MPESENPSPSVGGSYCEEVAGHPGVRQDVSPALIGHEALSVWVNGSGGGVRVLASSDDLAPPTVTVEQLATLAEALLATL